MTDPTQHHNSPVAGSNTTATGGVCANNHHNQLIDDKNSIIKRNSLNDAANRRREVDQDGNGGVGGDMPPVNACIRPANRGDSTSTILSTDSGVSCFDLESISSAAAPPITPSLPPPHPRLAKG